jgi:hypothetical protein
LQEDPSGIFFTGEMTIDADGSPHAYHKDNSKGLDYLANAGHPGNWWALVTDAAGNPIVQNNTDPAPGFYISTTALENTAYPKAKAQHWVDSETIPFIVLPGGKKWGQKLGDFAIVYNTQNGKITGAVYADVGPRDHIGEASIACANALGINSNPKHGGITAGVVYLFFPNSKTTWPLTATQINTKAMELFTAWGGLSKLKTVAGV